MRSNSQNNLATPLNIPINNDENVGKSFFAYLSRDGDHVNQIDSASGAIETNNSLLAKAMKIATEIRSRGVTKDDIVVMCSKTHSEQSIALLAIFLSGAIAAPIDPDISSQDLKAKVSILKPHLAFCDQRASVQLENALRQADVHITCQIIYFGADHQKENMSLSRLLAQEIPVPFVPALIKNPKKKIACIVSTSASTGEPKLVSLSHYSILVQIKLCEMLFQQVDRVVSFFPLSWITELIIRCCSFSFPFTRIVAGVFAERPACKLIHDCKIDTVFLSTHFAIKMINHAALQDFDMSCMRAIFVGGMVTTSYDMVLIRSHLPKVIVIQIYGLAEMGCIVAGFTTEERFEALQRPGSIGRLLPGVNIRIVDLDTKEPAGRDFWGELLVSGPCQMLGYYNDPKTTKDVVQNGFVKTGDIAQYDAKGFLYIQCRIDDLIYINSIRVCPIDLEDLLLTHPCIREALVIGDGKEVVACIVQDPDCPLTAEKIMTFIAERTPENRRPNRIKFCDNFPKTTVGKAKKFLMKQNILGVHITQSKSIADIN